MKNKPLDFIALSLDTAEALAEASAAQVKTALLLALYCGKKFQGKIIFSAKNWTKKQWMMNCFVSCPPKENAKNLWHFDGDDLHIDIYSEEYENKVKSKRKAQANIASKRWIRDNENVCHGIANAHAMAMPTNTRGIAKAPAVAMQVISNKYNENMAVDSTTVCVGGEAPHTPPLPPKDFEVWIKRVCSTRPELEEMPILPKDVELAAQKAWRVTPNISDAKLTAVKRYYAFRGDLPRTYYRPPSYFLFFRDLHDIIRHALQWCRLAETATRRQAADEARRQARAEASKNAINPPEPSLSNEELKTQLNDLKNDLI